MSFTEVPAEATTAATDLVMAILTVAMVFRVNRIASAESYKIRLWSAVFGLLAMASLCGAIAHGIALPRPTYATAWHLINLTLGLSLGCVLLGAMYDAWGERAARRAAPVVVLVCCSFFAFTVMSGGGFIVFIVYESIILAITLALYAWLWWRRERGGALMTIAVLITILAAAVQTTDWSLELIWVFDHNGLFHIVQIFGVLLFLAGIQQGLAPRDSTRISSETA